MPATLTAVTTVPGAFAPTVYANGNDDCSDGDEEGHRAPLIGSWSVESTHVRERHSSAPALPLLRCVFYYVPAVACWSSLNVMLLLSLLAVLDHFLFPPHGLLPLRYLTRSPDHSPPTICGWDYEASWKIGHARGSSPINLVFQHKSSVLNPLLTCSNISSPPVSFVADPFLIIVDSLNRSLSFPLHPGPHTPSDVLRMYLFYEMKNLVNMRGEIGVSVSDDNIESFKHVGTALAEPFHLSYPLPLYHQESQSFLLIPECYQTLSVRIYTTSAASFPFGWALHSTPLTGRRFVDTSPVYYRGLWYVFTTDGASLLLFLTPDLLDPRAWTPHPLSPLVSYNRKISRSAGRPTIHDGRVVRFTQDDSVFYGMAVYAFELEELSPTSYKEVQVAVVKPREMAAQGSQWASERLHHMDVKHLGRAEWLAVVDGDDHAPNYEFWRREGWWRTTKDCASAVLLVLTARMLLLECRMRQPLLPQSNSPTSCASRHLIGALPHWVLSVIFACRCCLGAFPYRSVGLFLMLFVLFFVAVVFLIDSLFLVCPAAWSAYELPGELTCELQKQEAALSLPLPPDVSARFNLSTFQASSLSLDTSALLDSVSAFTYPDSSASFALPALPAHPPLPPLGPQSSASFPQQFLPFPGFIVVTAASSSYFDRLQNFVGSVHFWEPSQRVVIFDLGLSQQQIDAVSCWQGVELRAFPFEQYPLHVRNLYNFAWKPLILEQAFALPNVTAVLMLDSGVELRAPHAFSDVKRSVMERGYWFAQQSYTVERRTRHQTLDALGIDVEAVKGRPFCAGGLHGFMKDSPAYYAVALRAVQCARNESCIAPAGSGRSTHNFDQSVMSALVYATGRRCDPRRSYRETDMSFSTEDETDFNARVVLLLRRWHQPKPYIRYIRPVLSDRCPFIPGLRRARMSYPSADPVDVMTLNDSTPDGRRQMDAVLIQHKDGLHLEPDSPLVLCLRRHGNSRYECRQEVHDHQRAMAAILASESVTMWAWLDVHITPLLRRVRCINTWLLTLLLTSLCWWAPQVLWQVRTFQRRVAVVFLVLLWLSVYLIYIPLLNKQGTSSPLLVWRYTRLHTPPSPYLVPRFTFSTPPPRVRPPFRVVFSLSSLPHEVAFINKTLSSLATQTLRPDAIHLNLPFSSHNNASYDFPSDLTTGEWEGVPLRVNRGDDLGPLTKLALTLQTETDPNTLIITVDSDKIYPATLSLALAHHARYDAGVAFGMCGWSFLFRPAPVGVVPIYVPEWMRGSYGREVDVLQASCGSALRRGWFPSVTSADFALFTSPHPYCFITDDLWIAAWLTTRAGVRKVLLPEGRGIWNEESVEPVTAEWKREMDERARTRRESGADGTWFPSTTESTPDVERACIRGVDQVLGDWKQLRNIP